LRQLAEDEYWEVRRIVARRPNCPVHLLEQLVKDKDKYVRRAVAGNPNCPVHLLEQLAKNENKDVRETAIKILKERRKNENHT